MRKVDHSPVANFPLNIFQLTFKIKGNKANKHQFQSGILAHACLVITLKL